MSNAPLSEKEHADLVAYLDGELTGEAARAIEAKLSNNPAARAEAEAYRRTWDLLDFLPRPDPSPSFTQMTISKLEPLARVAPTTAIPPQRKWRTPVLLGGWAAALLIATVLGYQACKRLAQHEPGDAELVRELRLIENKRYYDLIDDVEFLRQLDQPDLFGEEGGKR